jgi:hypothetical protein
MLNVEAASRVATDDAAVPAFDERSIRTALEEALASPEFRSSRRCQDFLKFVVEQTLLGRAGQLKERTIGVEAFGRSASYDTNGDGVVRIRASEVRRRLGLYYAAGGKDSAVRIDLPVGGYTPKFSTLQTETEQVPAAAVSLAPTESDLSGTPHWPRTFRKQWTIGAFVVAGIVLAAVIMPRRRSDVLNEFWKPVLQSSNPVLIAAAYVPVYAQGSPEQTASAKSPTPDYVLLRDQFVGGGDLVAAARLAGMLGRMRHSYVVKVGSIAFEDLRNSPTILIGYSSNQWAAVSSRLRFYIDDDRGVITDNGKPTSWYLHHANRQHHTDEDYAIVSRVFDRQTHAMLLEAAGIDQYGTEAAGEVITDHELLEEALRSAPAGWERKNLQFVLHMNVIANYPATPKLIASYYW